MLLAATFAVVVTVAILALEGSPQEAELRERAVAGDAPTPSRVQEVRRTQRIGGRELTVARHGDHIEALDPRGLGRAPWRRERVAQATGEGESAASASTVPATCSPVDRADDDAANATHAPAASVIKVIYAHPSDVGNRLSTYAPVIQAGTHAVGGVVAAESGGIQSIRFDLGTSAGPGCVDIQRVALAQPASYYTADPSNVFTRVKDEVRAALGVQSGVRNFLVYADGITRRGIAGEAELRFDDSAAGTFQNVGNLWALLYGRGGTDFFGATTAYPAGTTSRNHVTYALHEISHTLGAVQDSAPNRSAYGHCLDEWDLLCYDDDGSVGLAVATVCASPYSATNESFDCNKDDYFNPSPAAGSHLARHWNLTRSVFMCPLETCGPPAAEAPPEQPQPKPPAPSAPEGQAAATSPDTDILSGPAGGRTSRAARFTFASSEPAAAFECQLDERRYAPCTSPVRYRRLRPGKHTFRVRALGRGGAADPSPAERRFRIRR